MSKTARNASARARASEDATDVTVSDPSLLAWLRAAWVLSAGAFTIVVLALASFNSADPPTAAVAVPNEPPLNLCGRFGAAIAYRLYEVLGLGVWVPLVYLGTLLAFLASGRVLTHPFVRFIGACVMMVAVGGLHNEWFPSIGPVAGYRLAALPDDAGDRRHRDGRHAGGDDPGGRRELARFPGACVECRLVGCVCLAARARGSDVPSACRGHGGAARAPGGCEARGGGRR